VAPEFHSSLSDRHFETEQRKDTELHRAASKGLAGLSLGLLARADVGELNAKVSDGATVLHIATLLCK